MANQVVSSSSDSSFLVKDVDGQFKVWHKGSLSSGATPPAIPLAPAPTPNYTQPAQIPADIHFLPAPSVGAPQDTAEFHFHPDDKEELQAEMSKIAGYLTSAAAKRKYSVEKIAAKILEKNQLKFNVRQEAEFISVLLSYFRQARSYVITREFLIQSLQVEPALADKIMVIVKNLKDKIEMADGVVVRGSTETGVEAEANTATVDIKRVEAVAPVVTAAAQPQLRVEVPPLPTRTSAPVSPVPEPPVASPAASSDLPRIRRAVSIEPVRLSSSVRAARPAKVMSRIDELAAMTLEEFRGLDSDPRMRAAKILQRIGSLEKESLARKAQAIAAWRSSGVYQTYLAMGHHGLEHGRNLGQIVTELQQQGQPFLSAEEFEAMTDLNKQLRF
ncbi:MAG: hypothetical protein V1846_01595 [Candidatus Komeilibacteria bacterium]